MPEFENTVEKILALCEGAYSNNTLRGYRKDLHCFNGWCVRSNKPWLPAEAETVAQYINEMSKPLSIGTIKRRLCAIRFAHRVANLTCPIEHSAVYLAVRRASRAKRRRPVQSLGLTSDIMRKLLAACPDSLAGLRDAALISTGYDTLCRSSELAAMCVEQIRFSEDGTSVFIPLSKGDPFGDGRIAYLSPQSAERLATWLDQSHIHRGPAFRGLHTGKVSKSSLDTSSIRRLIKAAARRAELPDAVAESLSGHSMRIGAAQDMLISGFGQLAIMQAGGWKSANVVLRYVENASTRSLHEKRWVALGEPR